MIVGITGHQELGSQETVEWITQLLNHFIEDTSITLGITCLAKGADQLYAELLFRHDIPYLVVIASKDYETTFSDPRVLTTYRRLLGQASQHIVLDNDLATESAFYDAGKRLVDKSDYIIAIWNGQPAKGFGGTADIVKYARQKGKRLLHINPLQKTVSEVDTAA